MKSFLIEPIAWSLGLRQIDRFNTALESSLHIDKNCNDYGIRINATALELLYKKYQYYYDFTHFQVRLGEIPSTLTSEEDYFKDNPKKIHFLFYAYDAKHHKFIDEIAYDLTYEIVHNNVAIAFKPQVAQLFIDSYQNHTQSILASLSPKYMNDVIGGLQAINIDAIELGKVLFKDQYFIQFDIWLGLTNSDDPELSSPYYWRLHDLDNTLNILFIKVSSNESVPDLIYDLNDACPPGNCK